MANDKIVKRGQTDIALPTEPITKITELAETFNRLRRTCNLLAPVAAVDSIMPMHQISLRTVVIDMTLNGTQGPDVYQDKRFCKDDEVALGKNGLAKLMGAAGVQIVQKHRLDDRSIRNYWEIEVALAVRDFDGQMRQVIATKELDLRDGSPDTMKPERICKSHNDPTCKKCNWQSFGKTGRMIPMEASAIADKRRHGQSLAETMAIERALRLIFGLPQKFKIKELEKPFVIPKLVPNFDMGDPEVKTAVLHHTLAGDMALYGSSPQPGNRLLRAVGPSQEAPDPALPASDEPEPEGEEGEGNGDQASPEPDTRQPAASAERTLFDDPSEFGEPTPPQPEATCGCPCGHDVAISKAVAQATVERAGSARCGKCWPWHKDYDPAIHDNLRTLGLKDYPELTPAAAKIAWSEARRRKNAA